MPGLIGSIGAALLGVATALTISRSRTIRTITAPGLAIGYAIVFTNDTNRALIVGYLVALTSWGVRLAGQTLRLAFPPPDSTTPPHRPDGRLKDREASRAATTAPTAPMTTTPIASTIRAASTSASSRSSTNSTHCSSELPYLTSAFTATKPAVHQSQQTTRELLTRPPRRRQAKCHTHKQRYVEQQASAG